MLVDGLGDQSPHISSYAMAIMRGDTKEAGELWKDYQNDHVTPFLDMFEKFLTENGGKYFVGDRLTWADLLIGEFIDRFVLFNNKNDSILAGHKKLAQHTKLIHELPNIKKYVANRPQTLTLYL
uniref:GST C-terminal domain-containing protein n=1 Tax=Romanomermis culicivorax TaxID=13658 RepID=A0A915J7C7_ROMCU